MGIGAYFSFGSYSTSSELASCLESGDQDTCHSKFLQQGIDAYAQDNFEEAIPYFVMAHEAVEDNKIKAFNTYRNEGNAYMGLQQYDKAEEIFRDLLTVGHPDEVQVYLDLISLFDRQKQYEKAIGIAEEAFAKHSNESVYLYKKASLLESLERYEDEIKVYEQILELVPEKSESVNYKIDKLKKVHNLE